MNKSTKGIEEEEEEEEEGEKRKLMQRCMIGRGMNFARGIVCGMIFSPINENKPAFARLLT